MAIRSHREVDRHRDEPAPPGFTAQVVWFVPTRKGGPRHAVSTVTALRRLLAPYRDHERLVIYLERDGGEAGSVWVHITGHRAWVTHWTRPGGIDSYCCDREYNEPGRAIGFLLSNGQLDEIDRFWTVSRAKALRALESFLRHGECDPKLSWVAEPRSLPDPPT